MEPGLDLAELVGQRGRQGGADLELSGGQQRAETEFGRGPGQAGQAERLGLVRAETGQPGPVATHQLVAAAVTGVAVQRNAGRVQRLDVPVDGADRHFELGGELGRGQAAPGLQEQEDRDQPAGAHAPIFH